MCIQFDLCKSYSLVIDHFRGMFHPRKKITKMFLQLCVVSVGKWFQIMGRSNLSSHTCYTFRVFDFCDWLFIFRNLRIIRSVGLDVTGEINHTLTYYRYTKCFRFNNVTVYKFYVTFLVTLFKFFIRPALLVAYAPDDIQKCLLSSAKTSMLDVLPMNRGRFGQNYLWPHGGMSIVINSQMHIYIYTFSRYIYD